MGRTQLRSPSSISIPLSIRRDESIEIDGRFRSSFLIHEENGKRVYFGREIPTGRRVVIRIVPQQSVATNSRLRIEHHAKVLKHLSSGFFARPISYSSNREMTVLINSYVKGINLKSWLRRFGKLSLENTLFLCQSLLLALKDLHDHGVLHQDIKPSNIIVNPGKTLGALHLIDLDFARSNFLDGSILEERVGTASYMSPEQSGIINAHIDERSDLYSLGVVLYEAISGTNPFVSATVGETLRKHLSHRPESLRTFVPTLPRILDEMILRLLAKDPRDRYQTAHGMLADLKELTALLQSQDPEPFITLGKSDKRTAIGEPSFVGREDEMRQLNKKWMETQEGTPHLVFLEGESGGGKTRILNEFIKNVRLTSGARIFLGKGLDQSAQRPYQMLVGIAEQIVKQASIDPTFSRALNENLADEKEAIVQALPELSHTFGLELPEITGPENFGEVRTLKALSALLDCLGSTPKPTLVLLDDCQWADELTVKLLYNWQRQNTGGTGKRNIFLVAAFRTEEVDTDHLLRKIPNSGHLRVAPLTQKQIIELVFSMAGTIPPEVLSLTHRLSQGSPFMVEAIVRGLVESEALFEDGTGWKVAPQKIQGLQSSRKAATFLVKRLELFSKPALEFLTIAAVLGKEFDIEVATRLLEKNLDQTRPLIQESTRGHVLWVKEATTASFSHDKLREAILQRLSAEERKVLHARVGRFLEREYPEKIFDLAFHFDAADEGSRAFSYALAGAKQARTQHSLEVAEQLYQIADRATVDQLPKTQFEVAEGFADILMLRGKYDRAEEYFQKALTLTTSKLQQVQIHGKLGELSFKRGNVTNAAKSLETALRMLGKFVPQSTFSFVVFTLWEIAVQTVHTFLPSTVLGRRGQLKDEKELLSIRLFSRLAYIYWFQKGRFPCAWAHFREMNLAERYSPTLELAQAYSEHAPVMTMVPYFKRGIEYAEKGLQIRKSHKDIWGLGQSLNFYGVALYGASRYQDCISKCQEAYRLLDKSGDRWEANTARWHVGFSLYRLGELNEAVSLFKRLYENAREIGDFQAMAISLSGWSKSTEGLVPRALIEPELGREVGDAHARVELHQGEAIRLLRNGAYSKAIETLEKAQRLIKETGLQQEYVAPTLPWLVTALRLQIENEKTSLFTLSTNQKRLNKALKVAKSALNVARLYRNNIPHIYRELALLSIMSGDQKKAERFFALSADVARQQGAKYELMKTIFERSRVGSKLGWSENPETIRVAEATLQKVQKVTEINNESQNRRNSSSLSIVDRLETLIEMGKKITSSIESQNVVASTQEAFIKLLRGEDCLVFKWNAAEKNFKLISHKRDTLYSKTLLDQVIGTGKQVIFNEQANTNITESIILQDVRSILCTPVFIRDQLEYCFYVVHGKVEALFSKEEANLAGMIAKLAGASLENAEGFGRLQGMNEVYKNEIQAKERAQKDLNEKATQLERTNRELERFAYIASHDLKEPLRSVLNNVRLLERSLGEKLTEDERESLQFAVDGANRMYQLIEGLLTYSRIGHSAQPKEGVDLNSVIASVLSSLQQAISENSAKILVEGSLPRLRADETELTQLFQNLIGNAIKFRRSDPPEIRIQVKEDEKEWTFEIRDNGVGIDPKYFERIFVIFQRLHDRSSYPGTGIGLAVCKRIVENLGGRIWVNSEPVKGTSFFFTLPRSTPTAAKPTD